ncbi:MAG: hypothetical protein E7658_05515 [Ruminococcaceae bacterium]|nr:hypothetical protein [Oscillospiraceae bacterium]
MTRKSLLSFLLCAVTLLGSCTARAGEQSDESIDIPAEVFYTDEDLAADLGISVKFPKASGLGLNASLSDYLNNNAGSSGSDSSTEDRKFPMKVYDSMEVYASTTSLKPIRILSDGDVIMLREIEGSRWAEVYYSDGPLMGYAKDGFMHTISQGSEVYAELPIEYGMAKTNQETYVSAYSHLVDVRKYFNVYSSNDTLSQNVDYSKYDLIVSMKLSTDDTTIGQPFYNSNICMVQYDLLPMLKKAIDLFKKDGYVMVIYDAYRPTSVQQRWFDVVKVHKWVANPAIGMGGVHDRGTAVDISLVNFNGKELEFPTPMHTFTEESARSSTTMTDTARRNMDYMLGIMVKCGFTYINSEWWHFQDVNTKYYLPTDHPIDTIPLVPSERNEVGTIPAK